MSSDPPRVFISHIDQDADFATAIATWLEGALLDGVRCFVGGGSIEPGAEWTEHIRAALDDSAIMLVLVSPESARSPWISFEAGAGFVRRIPVVPLCIAGMSEKLDLPLSMLQALRLPNDEDERKLLALVAKPAGLRPARDSARLVLPSRTSQTGRPEPPSRRVFSSADAHEFTQFFQSLVSQAERVVLVGTGLNVLYRSASLELLGTPSSTEWAIYVANPYAPELEWRLIEEEMGSPSPPVGKEGLIKRLETLLGLQKQRPDTVRVRLFSHYPTMTFFIIDGRHYFFYPYGFLLLGDYSPVIYFSRGDPEHAPLVKFLERQYEATQKASVDASLMHELRSSTSFTIQQRKHAQEHLTAVAVYIVPPEGSDLYEFGSNCLGSDIRNQSSRPSPWAPGYVETAAEFGFHVTVADALYFVEDDALPLLVTELGVLGRGFRPFDLHFELKDGFPDERSISLLCHDDTGTLEALHHELVARFYSRAVASNYSRVFGTARAGTTRNYGTNPRRAELMIGRYHAPYILNEFRPHFSLLSNVEADALPASMAALQRELPPSPFTVTTLCLLTKRAGNNRWHIHRETSLGNWTHRT